MQGCQGTDTGPPRSVVRCHAKPALNLLRKTTHLRYASHTHGCVERSPSHRPDRRILHRLNGRDSARSLTAPHRLPARARSPRRVHHPPREPAASWSPLFPSLSSSSSLFTSREPANAPKALHIPLLPRRPPDRRDPGRPETVRAKDKSRVHAAQGECV